MLYRVCKNKDNPYVMIDKRFLNDENLSWKAKGILAYLLTLPDEWKIYQNELVKHSKDGLDSLRNGIQELIDAGYIVREQLKDESGKFIGYQYDVFENPTIYEDSPRMGFSNSGKSNNGKSNNGKSNPNNKYNKIINNKNNKLKNIGETKASPISPKPKQNKLIDNLTNDEDLVINKKDLEKTMIRKIKEGNIDSEILTNPAILDVSKKVIKYLNDIAKKRFRSDSKITIGLIGYHLGEGYSEEDFKKVIDKKYKEWVGTEFEKYLAPETLFGEKFTRYLNEPEKVRYKDQYRQQDRAMEEMQKQYEKERELIGDEIIGII